MSDPRYPWAVINKMTGMCTDKSATEVDARDEARSMASRNPGEIYLVCELHPRWSVSCEPTPVIETRIDEHRD